MHERTLTVKIEPSPEQWRRLRDLGWQGMRYVNRYIRARLADALTGLNEIDREIVTSRTLKHPAETINDLAARLNMNTTKVRQVERRAMSRLKNELLARGVTTSRAE